MVRTNTYVNFQIQTEEAFEFYKNVFGKEYNEGGIRHFRDAPPSDDTPPIDKEELDLVLDEELEILGGHILMGTDAPESMGFKVNFGSNFYIDLAPDTRKETVRRSRPFQWEEK